MIGIVPEAHSRFVLTTACQQGTAQRAFMFYAIVTELSNVLMKMFINDLWQKCVGPCNVRGMSV